jgi:hypothetical protein
MLGFQDRFISQPKVNTQERAPIGDSKAFGGKSNSIYTRAVGISLLRRRETGSLPTPNLARQGAAECGHKAGAALRLVRRPVGGPAAARAGQSTRLPYLYGVARSIALQPSVTKVTNTQNLTASISWLRESDDSPVIAGGHFGASCDEAELFEF